MLNKLMEQIKFQKRGKVSSMMTSPIDDCLKKQSEIALKLYEKTSDIKKFTGLALSNPEDDSHNKIVNKMLGNNDIIDPLDEEHLRGLIGNDNFLRDLGL